MPPSSNPLQSLLGPLRFACQRNFANLPRVKELRAVLDGAVRAAEGQGAAPAQLAALKDELRFVDHPIPRLREASLRRVLRALGASGVALPEELARVAEGASSGPAEASATAEKGSAAPPRAPPRRPTQKSPAQESLLDVEAAAAEPAGELGGEAPGEDAPDHGEEAPPAPSAGRGKRGGSSQKRALPSPDLRAEARLLSIAPRAGPLATPLRAVGWRLNPRLLAALNRKGLRKVGDVLFLLPRCYEDRRRISRIAELRPGERGVTVGTVTRADDVFVRGGRRRIFRAVIADASGSIACTYFQGGSWLKARFPIGKKLVVSGELRASPSGREMTHPEIEPADDLEGSAVHFNRIVPIYPGFERHEQRALRDLAFKISEQYAKLIEEPLPSQLRARLGLMGLGEALARIHFPEDGADLELLDKHLSPAHRRLAFDELFFLQLGMALKRQGVKTTPGIAFDVSEERQQKARALLPFQLTAAQGRVVKHIAKDMGKPEPMNRLLQGDVGSGKTAVAVVAAALALQDGYQVAVMAPTEILAEQHLRNFQRMLEPLRMTVGLFRAGGKQKERQQLREALASGALRCAVGTHALIQGEVEFARLGLVIIDEQHRFGVMQRHALMSKGHRPDVLVMTATPIPRTLAMTFYGDLELSVIDELPPGRTPILTRVYSEKARARVYDAMRAELHKGHQCYVVYPLVEESEKLDLADATQGAQTLAGVFPEHKVGLLHGRMKQEEKEQVMRDFRERRIHVLVSTTVVEVGVDVPNASVMVIEHAERMGLSQLHQLRGRVGRGAAQSFCFLLAGYARSRESSERLKVMELSADGFVIAEKDLELRGPGEFLGTRQSGIPELAVANLARDGALLSTAREEALAIVKADPALDAPDHQGLIRALEERWEGRLSLARVG